MSCRCSANYRWRKPATSNFSFPAPNTPFCAGLLLFATSWTNLVENQPILGLSYAGSEVYQTPLTPTKPTAPNTKKNRKLNVELNPRETWSKETQLEISNREKNTILNIEGSIGKGIAYYISSIALGIH